LRLSARTATVQPRLPGAGNRCMNAPEAMSANAGLHRHQPLGLPARPPGARESREVEAMAGGSRRGARHRDQHWWAPMPTWCTMPINWRIVKGSAGLTL
jgi:hypothetical protein